MSKLKFNTNEVKTLLSKIGDSDELTLVGDQGVYLMSFAEPMPRTIVYAEGCNPNKDEDFYENKRSLYGGDDGGDVCGTKVGTQRIVNACKQKLYINLTPIQISMSNK